jgi:hypothetical protein
MKDQTCQNSALTILESQRSGADVCMASPQGVQQCWLARISYIMWYPGTNQRVEMFYTAVYHRTSTIPILQCMMMQTILNKECCQQKQGTVRSTVCTIFTWSKGTHKFSFSACFSNQGKIGRCHHACSHTDSISDTPKESSDIRTKPDCLRCRLILLLLKYPARCLSIRLLYVDNGLKNRENHVKLLTENWRIYSNL